MKRTVFLAACVLLLLYVLFRGLICSTAPDSRVRMEEPGNRPVSNSDSSRHHVVDTPKKVQEVMRPENNLTKVLICKGKKSHAYHDHDCRGLKRCKAEIESITQQQAEDGGYRPCKFCY